MSTTAPATGGPAVTPVGPNVTEVQNPLGFDEVEKLLGKILSYLQSLIVLLAMIFIVIGGFLYITSAGDSSRAETAKKCITAALFGLALAIAAPAFLKEIGTILGWGPQVAAGLPAGVGTRLTLLEIATNILNFLLSVVGVLALIMLVVGGAMYLLAAGDEDRIDTGKKIVKYSIVGILIALGSLVLVRQIANFF